MLPLRTFSHRTLTHAGPRYFHFFVLILILLTACQGNPLPSVGSTPAGQAALPEHPKAEVTFSVQIPGALAEGQSLFVEVLDEVTGLALNPARLRLESEDGVTFSAKAPFAVGSVIKYRYLRDNDPVGLEYNTLNQQVRYRLFVVDGPSVVEDQISGWKSQPASGSYGRIQGQVATKKENAPIVNALVTAGGLSTLTASDGSFLLEGLTPGMHNMVVYSLDGAFRPFQQGAVVGPDSTTPAVILVTPNQSVDVTFVVHPPQDSTGGVPVRLIGNIYSLGNTFADLRGGVSVIASRAPLMKMEADGSYSLTIKLPVGLDLRYKYTLGDGFWNAERGSNGEIRTRQLIVPDKSLKIEDTIASWKTPGLEPVTFNVTVPDTTSNTETISIQFNPYGWTEPIPMWPQGNNKWFYVLYNPLKAFESAGYRYCRNEQCGSADAVETSDASAKAKTFSPKDTPQTFDEAVSAWAQMENVGGPIVVPSVEIAPREADFTAAVELLPRYHPSWQPYGVWAFQNLKDIGANTVILSPTWRMTHQTPPVMEPVPGKDALWADLTQQALIAQKRGLGVMIHPVLTYNENPQTWWQSAARSDGWWQSWFDRYSTYVLYHADLAAQTGAQALILGDENLLPALPGGLLQDGSPSGVPANAEERWQSLMETVKTRFKGKLVWMLPYAGQLPTLPAFLKSVDVLYVQVSAPLADSDQPVLKDLEDRFAKIMDEDLQPLQEANQQPVIVGLRYPSASGAFDGCVEADDGCLPAGAFLQPAPKATPALQEQADAYSAALSAVNQRGWVTGFIASGYDPVVGLKDASISTRSKPAADVLWFWFPRLTGQTAP